MLTPGSGGEGATSRVQDAVRILLIISAAATDLDAPPTGDLALVDAIGVLETQVKLQKLDFWVRNPDYLANELLDDFESTADPRLLELAAQILESDEPEVRRYPMLRYLFGAYEPLDDALAILRSAGLVVRRTFGPAGRIRQHNYYITVLGRQTADRILIEAPALRYFVERARLVAAFAADLGGTALKQRQYLQSEYQQAQIGTHIGSIASRTRARLKSRRAAPVT